uniref:Elongin-A n=1 Tax=Neogobius melanostomus TaxID=47308 RepID=A0A8C6S995_9GOBI
DILICLQLVKSLRRLGDIYNFQHVSNLWETACRLNVYPAVILCTISQETGVGKAVNSLRKHDIVGELAKSLVAKWKKLVPQTADRPSNSLHTKPQTHRTEERGHKRVRDPSPEPSPEPSYDQDQEEDEEEVYNPNYSPQYGSPQRNSYQSDEYDSPQPEVGGMSDSVQLSVLSLMLSLTKISSLFFLSFLPGRPRAPKDSPTNGEEEEFKAPSMSFESFLTYDAPISVKKKKKPTPSSTATSSSSHPRPSNGSSKRPHSSSKSSSSSGPPQEKRKRVVEPVPTLPDIPLPAIQPNYRPLPSIDVTPLSPQRRKVAVCNADEDAVFTGKRLNSKMVVFSGSKTSYLPRMMTLFEQCIRVLQNNIDSIAEVGGVPFEILEPVLERCTPEQLYRIEQSNQCFTEDSDELWMRHCQRDFKREQPQEYESWRELYLRLHDEREERLRLLTQNISSAHASKPKGRQVKMAFVNSVAKPPRDIRRRQERFGTSSGSSAASTAAAAPIKVRPVFTAEPSESSGSGSSSSSLSQSSLISAPRSSTPSIGSSPGASARDKPQVKSKAVLCVSMCGAAQHEKKHIIIYEVIDNVKANFVKLTTTVCRG